MLWITLRNWFVDHRFLYVVFSFSSKYILISFEIFLSHGLFIKVLFNLQIFELSPKWPWWFLQQLAEACFMDYHIIYISGCSTFIWKIIVLCFCWVQYSITVRSSWSTVFFLVFYSLNVFLPTHFITYWESLKFPNYNCEVVFFSFQFWSFLLHIQCIFHFEHFSFISRFTSFKIFYVST